MFVVFYFQLQDTFGFRIYWLKYICIDKKLKLSNLQLS